ncbi:VOC family protein [Caulobacter sp. SLTY]|uniref:VOC family protein n=1 Tax=Caulobacter sp. SLTY TaxID=2683262 RepID=UPI00141228AC|nr:VOC family protein [Caulobacter sp. SLTY]NBB16906.1 VOC family protein [Caulobacter sp. SLTY]
MAWTRPALVSALCYRDPRAALKFLEDAFGFEIILLIEDEAGNVGHSEMRFGTGAVMVGSEWTEEHKSPASIGGMMTQTVHIQVEPEDGTIDAHCERARKAGALIIQEPEDQFYGDRTYRCKDPEGHIWTVGQTVRTTSPEDWHRDTGLKATIIKE